jgi:hypothetical protein
VLGRSDDDTASSLFVCNSDVLYFNDRSPALAPVEVLLLGQIYFVLQAAMLDRLLLTADMATLAVRATTRPVASRGATAAPCPWRWQEDGRSRHAHAEEIEDGGEVDVFVNEMTQAERLPFVDVSGSKRFCIGEDKY